VTKSEFERRAAEMKARNLSAPRFRNLSPPRSIFAPLLAAPFPAKVYVRDFIHEVDIKRLSPPLAAIKKLDRLETDRDGLLDCSQAGFQISVSPDLLPRGIKAYDAVLRTAAERGWLPQINEGSVLRILICGEPFDLAVTEKTGLIADVKVRPGERRQRRPTGALTVSLTAGYRNVMVSDKRGTQIESKLPDLFMGAEALAAEVHAEPKEKRRCEGRKKSNLIVATNSKGGSNGWTGTSSRGVALSASAHTFRRWLIGWQRRSRPQITAMLRSGWRGLARTQTASIRRVDQSQFRRRSPASKDPRLCPDDIARPADSRFARLSGKFGRVRSIAYATSAPNACRMSVTAGCPSTGTRT
jgi:hypothetical protein